MTFSSDYIQDLKERILFEEPVDKRDLFELLSYIEHIQATLGNVTTSVN